MDCRALSEHVIVDHRPSFFTGEAGSAGDYVARGEGTCEVGGTLTRWAYFVAAPGFGPVRQGRDPDIRALRRRRRVA